MEIWYPTPFTSTTTRWGCLLASRPRIWAINSTFPQPRFQRGGVMVADGDGQGVTRVRRGGRLRQAQQHPDHLLNLPLDRLAVTRDPLLHLPGRVLVDL